MHYQEDYLAAAARHTIRLHTQLCLSTEKVEQPGEEAAINAGLRSKVIDGVFAVL